MQRTRNAVDGFQLAYEREGSGPPVVLLHGWPGASSDYGEVAKRLEADVIRPDLRGFGESDRDRAFTRRVLRRRPGGQHHRPDRGAASWIAP